MLGHLDRVILDARSFGVVNNAFFKLEVRQVQHGRVCHILTIFFLDLFLEEGIDLMALLLTQEDVTGATHFFFELDGSESGFQLSFVGWILLPS